MATEQELLDGIDADVKNQNAVAGIKRVKVAQRMKETVQFAKDVAAAAVVPVTARVAAIEGQLLRNKGTYVTPLALTTANPSGVAGDYALVTSTDTFWVYDVETGAWKNSNSGGGSATFDDVPTQNSEAGIKSKGVYSALQNKVDKVGNYIDPNQLLPKPPLELVDDVVSNVTGYTEEPGQDYKFIIRGGVPMFIPDVSAAPTAPTGLARMRSQSNNATNPDGSLVYYTGLAITLQGYENSCDIFGLATVPAGHDYTVLWRILNQPSGGTAQFHNNGGFPLERRVNDSYIIGMETPGVYNMDYTVTDTVTGLSSSPSLLRITKS